MTQSTETEDVDYAEYYQCSGGLTINMSVMEDGQIVAGDDMGFTVSNPPLSEEEQEEKYGRVLYKEYEPDEEELEAMKVSVIPGMQAPGEPKVTPPPTAKPDLAMLSRAQLRTRAKSLGLNFPEDTARDQMIGAIEKKEAEMAAGEEAPAEEEEETSA